MSVQPREYLKDTSKGGRRFLQPVRCPFCHKKIKSEQEPEFRSHLLDECDEAPREVNYGGVRR